MWVRRNLTRFLYFSFFLILFRSPFSFHGFSYLVPFSYAVKAFCMCIHALACGSVWEGLRRLPFSTLPLSLSLYISSNVRPCWLFQGRIYTQRVKKCWWAREKESETARKMARRNWVRWINSRFVERASPCPGMFRIFHCSDSLSTFAPAFFPFLFLDASLLHVEVRSFFRCPPSRLLLVKYSFPRFSPSSWTLLLLPSVHICILIVTHGYVDRKNQRVPRS